MWSIVQKARIHATGKREFEGSRVIHILGALKPYASLSSEILEVHQKLADYLYQQDPFYADKLRV